MSATEPEPASELQAFLGFARCKIEGGLTATQRKQMLKVLILLLNDSPKALRLAKMYNQGQIDGDTLLEMMG